jgi:hypothetical protein
MRRIRRRSYLGDLNLLSPLFLLRFRNTLRLHLVNASRVRDGLRIDFLRSESHRALIARVLVGGILSRHRPIF